MVVPCEEAKNGQIGLMVDSGADTSLVKLSSLTTDTILDGTEKMYLSGAFGGEATTEGAAPIQHSDEAGLKFHHHAVPTDMGLPGDGLLGRDILWDRTITDAIDKKLIFKENGQHIASLPLVPANGAN